MPKSEKAGSVTDWSLATWDGSRRETLRRWAQLPLDRMIAALEEMQELGEILKQAGYSDTTESSTEAGSSMQDQKNEKGC